MVEYKIYTERKNVKAVSQLVSEHYGGFMIYFTKGYWQGKPERSMVIEILCDGTSVDDASIGRLCQKIKGLNRQEVVFLTKIRCGIWRGI
jgi:hypothetical protein